MHNINHKFDNLPLMSVRGIDRGFMSRRMSVLSCEEPGLGCEESGLGCKGPGLRSEEPGFGWERPAGFCWKKGLTKLVEGGSGWCESDICLMILGSEIEK